MATRSTPKELAVKKKKTAPSGNKTVNKKTTKKINKQIDKAMKKNPFGFVLAILFLIVGVVGGYFGFGYVTKGDNFAMNDYTYINQKHNLEGETALSLYSEVEKSTAVLFIGETYKEAGTKCVAFGQDISDEVSVSYYFRIDISYEATKIDNINTLESGFYYAVYKVNNFRYMGVELIRNIIVLEVELDG